MTRHRSDIFIILFLVVITLVVYGQIAKHEFINYDDNRYVTENPQVQAGWTAKSLIWALTTTTHGHWHPMTWLSHMTDCQFFGLNPAWHHLMNLLLHTANTILLFLVLRRMTGAPFRSALVAALFSLHPLHVEPVAWVAARKDVLSTFFWLLTLAVYIRYCERPGLLRYVAVMIAFVAALAAKSMTVTLPLVLLLLDYWPLGRLNFAKAEGEERAPWYKRPGIRVLAEKTIPLLFLGASAVATVAVMKISTKAAISIDKVLPTKEHLGSSLIFYVTYVGKTLWPSSLALPYPHTEAPPVAQVLVAGILFFAISFLALRWWRSYPYLAVGWLWYVVTLLPVIGIIPFGPHDLADRYTYIPLIGLFIIIGWGVPDFLREWQFRRVAPAAMAGAALSALSICSWVQAGHWENSVSLFSHTVRVTSENYKAHNNLGLALEAQGDLTGAVRHYSEAARARPNYPKSHRNLALALGKQGQLEEALPHFLAATRLEPGNAQTHYNLGVALARLGRLDEAIGAFRKAVQIKPDYAEAHNSLGTAYATQGRLHEAATHFREALRAKPDFDKARGNLNAALKQLKESPQGPDGTGDP